MRDVYPGFLQLHGFVTMNLDRHMDAHSNLFLHLVKGDGDSAHEASRVLRRVSRRHGPDRRVLSADGRDRVRPPRSAERRDDPSRPAGRSRPRSATRALLTVEGEHDDISGVGQTEAAHKLCANIPTEQKAHYLQLGVGHYGVFNGSRFRSEIAPRISDFILSVQMPAQGRQARRTPLKVVG